MLEGLMALIGFLAGVAFFALPFVILYHFIRERRIFKALQRDVAALLSRVSALEANQKEVAVPPPLAPQPAVPREAPVAVPQEIKQEYEPVAAFEAPPPSVAVPPVAEEPPVREPVQAVPEQAPSRAASIGRVHRFLAGIGLLPPAIGPGRDRETVLMQWWLPRIGGFLALLSALFFGVYINQSTSALFKVVELAVVSLAIAGIGRMMERKYATFGGVVLVTGLIMLYLTSVAAYVLPATRVLENPLHGSLVQAAVLAAICGVGLLRRSSTIVMLAFGFGLFLGVFMAWEGLREGALIAAAMLFAAGALLSWRPLFRPLLWLVVPGPFVVALAFPVLASLRSVAPPQPVSMQVFINAVFAGVALLYLLDRLEQGRTARVLLSTASSLAIAAAVLFFRVIFPDDLDWAMLVLGINMLAWSIAGWLRRGCGFLAQLLFVKGMFLLALFIVLHYAGDTRWMALGLQTIVVAATARRSRALAFELSAWAVGVWSLMLYSVAMLTMPAYGSFTWWMMVLYPAVLVAGFSYLLPVFDKPPQAALDPSRRWAYGLVPVLACAKWIQLFESTAQRDFEMAAPFVVIAYAAGLLALVPWLSRWMLVFTAGMAFTLASILYCTAPFSLVLLALILLAAACGLYVVTRTPNRAAQVAENALYALALTPLALWLLQTLDDWPGQAALVYALSGGMLLLGTVPRLRHAGTWALLPPVVFILAEYPAQPAGIWYIVALAVGIVVMAVPAVVPSVAKGIGCANRFSIWSVAGTGQLWLYALLFGDPQAPWLSGQVVFAVVALLLLAIAWRWPEPGYLTGFLLFLLAATLRHYNSLGSGFAAYSPWKSEALISAVLLYACVLAWFFLKPFPFTIQDQRRRGQLRGALSCLGGLLLFHISFVTFGYREIGWISWYTPILAVTAFLMILLGLFFRDSVYRRLGLLALLVPLGRLFIVDVKDVLHRIIAFAAAAVVLTVLGYLYHRLAERLKRD